MLNRHLMHTYQDLLYPLFPFIHSYLAWERAAEGNQQVYVSVYAVTILLGNHIEPKALKQLLFALRLQPKLISIYPMVGVSSNLVHKSPQHVCLFWSPPSIIRHLEEFRDHRRYKLAACAMHLVWCSMLLLWYPRHFYCFINTLYLASALCCLFCQMLFG